MKKIFALLLVLSVVAFGCKNSSEVKDQARAEVEGDSQLPTSNADTEEIFQGPTTTIAFQEDSYDYGTVNSGDVVKHTFEFTNTGDEPLVLKKVQASCGCTTPSWSKDPIAPGKTGTIVAEFNTAGKSGQQLKTITVTANTDPAIHTLKLNGDVLKEKTTDS